jgi:hypothetical protein
VGTGVIREIELHFGGEDPHMTVHAVEVSCGTELAMLAYSMQRQQRADLVSFGPQIDRDADGLPLHVARRN